MNTEMMTALQTSLAEIGRKGKFAPPKSQDTADPIAHEFLIADIARSLMQKRYDAAKSALMEEVGEEKFNKIRDQTQVANASVTEEVMRTENYGCTVRINAPSAGRVDAKQFATALIKLGVPVETVFKAQKDATISTAAATYLTVVPVRRLE